MQVRKVPVLLSMLATLSLLFGGWFLYQKTEVEGPIRTAISQMTSATLADLQVEREHITIRLTVKKPEPFPQEYMHLHEMIDQIAPGKDVDIELTNQDASLSPIWQNGLFSLTEAVDLRQYSRIPALLADWKRTYGLDVASTSMDEANVYVFLKRGEAEYYAVLPRELANPASEVTEHG